MSSFVFRAGITSAGAVIVDSIEYWANDAFSAAAPPLLYSFTAHVVGEKVSRLIEPEPDLPAARGRGAPLLRPARERALPTRSRQV